MKPDFWTDEKVVQVSDSAKLLFQGLWCLADREGRLEDKPVAIGFKVRPWDPMRADALLAELATVGLITRYEADGKRCIAIPTLPQHQRLHPREMASKLPAPDGSREKANLGEPRHAIAPGSAGPSGPAGPSGSSEDSPSREAAKGTRSSPTRKLSAAERFYRWAVDQRARRTPLSDEPASARTINGAFGPLIEAQGRPTLEQSYLAFLDEPAGASMNPPWPWPSFVKRAPGLKRRALVNPPSESQSLG